MAMLLPATRTCTNLQICSSCDSCNEVVKRFNSTNCMILPACFAIELSMGVMKKVKMYYNEVLNGFCVWQAISLQVRQERESFCVKKFSLRSEYDHINSQRVVFP